MTTPEIKLDAAKCGVTVNVTVVGVSRLRRAMVRFAYMIAIFQWICKPINVIITFTDPPVETDTNKEA